METRGRPAKPGLARREPRSGPAMPGRRRRGPTGETWFPPLLSAAESADVVRETDEEEQHDEEDSDGGHALVDLAADSAAADSLHDRERDVAAVQRQQRQQVQQRERQADQPEHPQVVLEPLMKGARGPLDDPNRARDVLPSLPVDEV